MPCMLSVNGVDLHSLTDQRLSDVDWFVFATEQSPFGAEPCASLNEYIMCVTLENPFSHSACVYVSTC